MCSRYAFVPDGAAWADFRAVLAEIAEELLALPALPKIAPTDRAPIVIRQPGSPPQLIQARWGFIPHWWSKTELPRTAFNARSEEAANKPMWRDALRATRCLIPATTWYEWQHLQGATAAGRRPAIQKVPHSLQPRPGAGDVEKVHDRMPVVLAPAAWRAWLDPAMTESAAALALLREHAVRAVFAVAVK